MPWHVPGGIYDPTGDAPSARALHLRFHALHLLAELSRFSPRLVGDLTVPEEDLPFFEGVELDVDPDDLGPAARHLRSMGYRIEPIERGFEAELLERIVVRSRSAEAPRGLAREALEAFLLEMYGPRCLDAPITRRY